MKPDPRLIPRIRRIGFSLVELLVSMTVLSMIMLMSARFIGQMQETWSASNARLEQFREARGAFEIITQSLRQATLNTYLTYEYNTGDSPTVPTSREEAPLKYIRHSELQFINGSAAELLGEDSPEFVKNHAVFFQAPMGVSSRTGYEGLQRLLCGRGYFIHYGNDDAYRPKHVQTSRTRFRLWEYRPTSEFNEVYSVTPGEWFAKAADQIIQPGESVNTPSHSRPVAENIVALIISPQITDQSARAQERDATWIAPAYAYDSTAIVGATLNSPQGTQHMLPPVVVVTLVAIDEASAARLQSLQPEGVPDLLPDDAFTETGNFTQDLAALEQNLRDRKLNYRVFSTAVPMRNSKWNQLYQ
ncbi:uncharacterized protein (TIGR02599 family) [Prosthecobacter fusiformis]|uniref:Uncharacterized protein (TIGR02599 family) n=1 Tax=Prosthecobacter fusiformis TaxID=48464 RepID=A0A4R7SQ91_9BACT|nr:Verru_Chthon cassette protein C [Prosthecobacter fusiformis]TDU80759.1 uncharacterized protein (TIGR02599 family) [Prosthecobacter fusiformis]